MHGAVGWRVLEPTDQGLKLAGHGSGLTHRFSHFVAIERRPSAVTGDLTLDEPPDGDVDRSRAEGGPIGRPRFVAHLHSRHPIARSPGAFLCSLLALSTSSAHVYVVDDVADALEE